MKICSVCRERKARSGFYKHPYTADGLLGKCKQCHKLAMKQNRRVNPDVQRRERERAKEPHRRAKARLVGERWNERFPEKRRAIYALNNAIRDGRAERGDKCTDCGSTENLRGIHADYSKPLEVVWRCALCHHRGRFAATPVQSTEEKAA